MVTVERLNHTTEASGADLALQPSDEEIETGVRIQIHHAGTCVQGAAGPFRTPRQKHTMNETPNYQSIDDIIPSRSVISKVRAKQVAFSLVVILFVSIGAIMFTQTYSSRSASTGEPSSDNPTMSIPYLIPTRSPAPTPEPSSSPTPTPTPTPKEFSNDGTPQMTPASRTSNSSSSPRPSPTATPTVSPSTNVSKTEPEEVDLRGKTNDKLPLVSSVKSSSSSSASDQTGGSQQTPASQPGSGQPLAPSSNSTQPASSQPNTQAPSSSTSFQNVGDTPAAATTAAPSQQQPSTAPSQPGSPTPSASSSSPFPGSSTAPPSPTQAGGGQPAATSTPTSTSSGTDPTVSSPPTTLDPPSPSASPSADQPPTAGSSPSSSQPTPQSAIPVPTPSPSSPVSEPVNDQYPTQPKSIPTSSIPRPTPVPTQANITSKLTNQRATTASRPQRAAGRQSVSTTPVPASAATQPSSSLLNAPHGQSQGGDEVVLPGDDIIRNPKEYPRQDCSLPNYLSKNGKMFAVGPDGDTQTLAIKGVNWFGMETNASAPLGLWSNNQNGTTLHEVASFLARNKFNSVRLPISIASVLNSTAPSNTFAKASEARALHLDAYTSTLQSIIEGLAYRQISVLISMDALPRADDISEERYFQAIDKLTSSLCTSQYWNVLGLDLKSGDSSTNGASRDSTATDFRAAATRIGNRMLEGCPNWLAFVQDIRESEQWTSPPAGEKYGLDAWSGGGLSEVEGFSVTLSIPDKVVYAPHYDAHPARYFEEEDGVTELSDEEVQENIKDAFDLLFGHLAKEAESPAFVLGEFAGLFSEEEHPQTTSQRTVGYIVKLISESNVFAGGYVGTLDSDGSLSFSQDQRVPVEEGSSDARTVNEPYLDVLKPLDVMPNLSTLQCFAESPKA